MTGRRRVTTRNVVLAIVAALAAMTLFGFVLELAGYEPPPEPTPERVISGVFTLVDDATAANDCVGPSGNWHEVHPGAQVQVRSDGAWLGEGALGPGSVVTWGMYGAHACAYEFHVGVRTADSYTVRYPGGLSVRYSFDDLESRSWRVAPDCCTLTPAN